MRDEARGWTESSPETLAAAMESYDHVQDGGAPRSPIENGLKLLLRVEKQQGLSLAADDRPKVVMAMARAMDLDDEVPKARVTSVMAARMIAVDVSLQRDAAISADMDVLDRRSWWSYTEANARRPAWMLGTLDLADAMRGLDETATDAVAAGDLHGVGGRFGARIKSNMEGLRSSGSMGRRDLDVFIMRAAGRISQEEAVRMNGMLVEKEGRFQVLERVMDFSRKAMSMDNASWPDPRKGEREKWLDTQKIAFRMIDTLQIAPAERRDPPDREAMDAARVAVADAGFSNPETNAGTAVRVARSVLTEIGVDQSLLKGEAFDRITATAMCDSTSFVSHEPIPRMTAEQIVSMTLLRDEADKRLARADQANGFPSATQRTAAFEEVRDAGLRNRELGVRVVLTEAPRDRADLQLMSQGRFDELSDRNGMLSNVSKALSAVGNGTGVAAKVSAELDVVQAGRDFEMPSRSDERPDGSLSKGPSSGKDWIADMAGFAKGLGATAR